MTNHTIAEAALVKVAAWDFSQWLKDSGVGDTWETTKTIYNDLQPEWRDAIVGGLGGAALGGAGGLISGKGFLGGALGGAALGGLGGYLRRPVTDWLTAPKAGGEPKADPKAKPEVKPGAKPGAAADATKAPDPVTPAEAKVDELDAASKAETK